MKVRVEVDTQTFVRFWLVVIGFAFAGFLIYSAMTGLIIVGTALFLALALNGPVSRLAKHLPGKSRIGSTAISFLVIIALLGSFLFLAVPPIIQQTAKFIETVPTLVDNATGSWQGLGETIDKYSLRDQVNETLGSVKDNASRWATDVGSNIISSVGSIFSFIAAFFLTIVLTFLMLIEGPQWRRRIWGLYADQEKMVRHRNVVDKMHQVVSGYVTGQLTVSGLGATFAGTAVFIISLFFPDVPANLAIPVAALTFILSLIPMFGATIAGILACLLLGFNAIGAAIAYGIYFIIYQQIENNFVSPTIQSKRLDLPPLAVLSAVTIGLYLFGIVGGIISIPIAGCIKVLLEDYLSHASKERKKESTPLHKLVKKVKDA